MIPIDRPDQSATRDAEPRQRGPLWQRSVQVPGPIIDPDDAWLVQLGCGGVGLAFVVLGTLFWFIPLPGWLFGVITIAATLGACAGAWFSVFQLVRKAIRFRERRDERIVLALIMVPVAIVATAFVVSLVRS
jgi:hypothetical protein